MLCPFIPNSNRNQNQKLQSGKFETFKDKKISSWIFFKFFFNLAFQFVMPEKKSGVPPWANNPGAPSWILVGKASKTSASPTFYRKKAAKKKASLTKIYGSGPENWRLRKISEKSEKSRYTNYIIAFVKF